MEEFKAKHPEIDKAVDSTKEFMANAKEKNATADVDNFIVDNAVVDSGPTKWRRRVRPAPMGRAYRQQRRYKHVRITIKGKDIEEG